MDCRCPPSGAHETKCLREHESFLFVKKKRWVWANRTAGAFCPPSWTPLPFFDTVRDTVLKSKNGSLYENSCLIVSFFGQPTVIVYSLSWTPFPFLTQLLTHFWRQETNQPATSLLVFVCCQTFMIWISPPKLFFDGSFAQKLFCSSSLDCYFSWPAFLSFGLSAEKKLHQLHIEKREEDELD